MNEQQTDDIEQTNAAILEKLRKLNSGITFKSAKDSKSSSSVLESEKSLQRSSSEESSENSEENKETEDEEWLREWKSKRSSICFVSNKTSNPQEPSSEKEQSETTYTCNFCKSTFAVQSLLIFHIPKCSKAPGFKASTDDKSQNNDKSSESLQRLLGSVSISKKVSVSKGITITPATKEQDIIANKSEEPNKSASPAGQSSENSEATTAEKSESVKIPKLIQKSRSATPEVDKLHSDFGSSPNKKEESNSQPIGHVVEGPAGTSSKSVKKPKVRGPRKKFKAAKSLEVPVQVKHNQLTVETSTSAVSSSNSQCIDDGNSQHSVAVEESSKTAKGITRTKQEDTEFIPKNRPGRPPKSGSKFSARKSARKRTRKRATVDFVQDYLSASSNSPNEYASLETSDILVNDRKEDPTFSPPRLDTIGLDTSKNYQFRRERRISESRPCVRCSIADLGTPREFEFHHLQHIIDKKLRVLVEPLLVKPEFLGKHYSSFDDQQAFSPQVDQTELQDSTSNENQSSPDSGPENQLSAEHSPISAEISKSSPIYDEPALPESIPKVEPKFEKKLFEESSDRTLDPPLKLTLKISKSTDGKKKKTVSIVNKDSAGSLSDGSTSESEMSSSWNAHSSVETPVDPFADHPSKEDTKLQPTETLSASENPPNSTVNESESVATPENNMTNTSNPVQESNVSESGSEALLTNLDVPYQTPNPPQNLSYEPQFESFTGDWMQEYDSGNRIAAAMSGATSTQGSILQPPQPENSGLFSQAVLGSSPNYSQVPQPNVPQGSFEEFCLNDQYGSMQNNASNMPQQPYNLPPNQYPYSNAPAAPIPPTNEMNINNTLLPTMVNNANTTQGAYNPIPPSNSPVAGNVPTSEFGNSSYPNQRQQNPSPVSSGQTPPLPAQPSSSQSAEVSTENNVPRLTIANNLMAQPSAPLPPDNGETAFNPQWAPPANVPNLNQTFPQPNQPRVPPPRAMAMAYRPSPRPRIRGRPPIIDQMPRPFRHGSVPMRARGSVNQRGYKQHVGQRFPTPQGVKRSAGPSTQSPSKASKREDINVPFRQKDTDCQIIAVANRNEGMPIISNIQGGTKDSRTAKSSGPPNDSTIHLSDSITLSVRSNNQTTPKRSEKGEQSGAVANLLASRGITVTPAAGEKESSPESSRSERRIPTASDLNLSSAISVHPPTSRDREGFAVPLPPSNRSSPSSIDRPPRPPTVDLTRDANRDFRVSCSQCDKTFPSEALLADHAKIHQQQAQSRMPFKCHLCSAGFSSRKGQHQHYQQFHQLHLSAGDLGIPIVDLRNPSNIQKMQRLGIKSFLPLNNLQNRGAGGVVGIPILSLENLNSNSIASLQQWGINDVLSLGPPKTINQTR